MQWAVRLCQAQPSEKWSWTPKMLFACLGSKNECFYSNVNSSIFKGLKLVKSHFSQAVLRAWIDNNHVNSTSSGCTLLWNNRNVTCKWICNWCICVLYETETVMIAVIKMCEWLSECVHCNDGQMHVCFFNLNFNAPECGKNNNNNNNNNLLSEEEKNHDIIPPYIIPFKLWLWTGESCMATLLFYFRL